MTSRLLLAATAACTLLAASGSAALAGPVDRACVRSDRAASNRALCGCIQRAADMTLSNSDQRRAAKFFSDPDLAHTVWISKRPADDAFWERYKQFTSMAEAYCGG